MSICGLVPVSYTHLDVYKRQCYIINNNGCPVPRFNAVARWRVYFLYLGSVSYTHLDVYKRQEQGRPSREVAAELGICSDTLRSWLKAAGAPSPGQAAVSYTHLDVYKRQDLHDAEGGNTLQRRMF